MLALHACEEIGPSIDFSIPQEGEYDTVYNVPVPAPQPKKVLVEDYTGVQCPNCPAAATLLKNYDDAHPDKIVVVGLHSGSLTTPIENESKHDFRNNDVQSMIINYLGGNVSSKPAAAIDRTPLSGTIFSSNINEWTGFIDQRAALSSPVNISLESHYDTATQKVTVKVKITYTQEVTKQQNLSVWVTESNIVDAQINQTQHIPDYVHNHVFRDFITPISGASFLMEYATKTPGLVYERQFIYEPKFLKDAALDEWNLDNCTIIAVVHNNEQGDVQVSQVADVHLK